MRISDDIYVYEWADPYDNNCNSFYIGGNVKALIDPGLTRYVPQLLSQMEQDGIDSKDIAYIINTHSHPDHYEGSAYFNGTGVQIALHEEEIDFLNGRGGSLYQLFGLQSPKVAITLVMKTGDLTLGGETFQVVHTPGHSPGSISLYSPDRKALFCGDVIFDQNVGRTDFPGGNGALLKRSIRTLSEMEVDCLFPGHMGIIDGKDNVSRNFSVVIRSVFPYI